MDSEGSEVDDLADIDLATFATSDRDQNFQSKESDWNEGRSTETEEDSLGESMDSRASSDLLQHFEVSGNLEDNTRERDDGNSANGPNLLSSSWETENEHLSTRNHLPNETDQTMDTSVYSVDSSAPSGIGVSTEVQGAQPVPGRAGYIQEHVPLRRLPGENLGMVLAIEGDQDNARPLDSVLVRSITPGGAAARAGEDGNAIHVGDEVREVDGCQLTDLTHDQCIEFFQNMPDHVMLTLHRVAPQDLSTVKKDQHGILNSELSSTRPPVPVPRPRGGLSQSKASDAEESVTSSVNSTPRQDEEDGFLRTPRGFVKLDLTVFRGDGDSLGLSIIPSHGATCDLYQVKRLLPGGACHESGCLEVHDRLLYCNGLSLKGLTQAQCLQVLKSSGHFVELTVLRQIDATATAAAAQNPSKTTEAGATELLDNAAAPPVSETEFAAEAAPHEEVIELDNPHLEENIESDSQSASPRQTGDLSSVPYVSQEQTDQYITPKFSSEEEEESVHEGNEQAEHLDSGYDTVSSSKKPRLEESKPDTLIDTIIGLDRDPEEREEIVNSETELSEQEPIENIPVESTSLIPPPVEFSDLSKADELTQPSKERFEECVTNIDDILFDLKENDEGDNKSPNQWPSPENHGVEQNSVYADNFTGSTVEEFAEQCFNNIENYTANETDLPSENQQNDSVLVDTSDLHSRSSDFFDANESNPQAAESDLIKEEPSNQHISTISVSTFIPSESPNPANVTTIVVSSSDLIKPDNSAISEVDSFDNIESTPDVSEERDARPDSPASPEIIELFGSCLPASTTMSSENGADSTVHTTMGVVTIGKDAQDEETIQPMVALKNAEGKVCVVKNYQDSVNSPDPATDRDKTIEQKVASVRETINVTTFKPQNSQPATRPSLAEPSVEEEIVPAKLDRAQKETVLHVLNNWTGETDEHEEKVSLQDVVAHFKRDKITPPENALVVHTIGSATTGSDDELIQPMVVTRDDQGKSFCVPVSVTNLVKKPENSAVDENDRKELASIAAKMTKFASIRGPKTPEASTANLAEEEHVVPAIRKNDHQLAKEGILETVREKEKMINIGGKAGDHDENSDVEEKLRQQSIMEQELVNSQPAIEPTHDADDTTVLEEVNSAQNGLAVDGEEIVRASTVISVQCTPTQASEDVSTVVVQDNVVSPTENRKSAGFLSAVRTFESGGNEQPARQLPTALRPKVKDLADVQSVVSRFEKPETSAPVDEQVALRPKTTRSSDFRAKIESFQAQDDAVAASSKTFVSTARPKSMIEVSSSSSGRMPLSKIDEIRKSFNTEPRLNPALRRVSAVTPLGGNTSAATRRISTGSRAFSGGMFPGTRSPRANLPHSRQEDGSPFQVDVLKGILGLGLKVKVTPESQVKVTDIQKGGPIEKDGHIRVGDFVTSINSTDLTGQNEVRVQQIIRLLPRGLVKLVVHSAKADSGSSKTAPSDGSEVGNEGSGANSSQVSDVEVAPAVQASTHTFILSGNKLEHVSGNSTQSSSQANLPSSSQSSDTSPTQPPLTARVEISSNVTSSKSGNLQSAAPLKIAIKPTATPRPAHPITRALAPRSPSLPTTVESAESPKDEPVPASRTRDVLKHTERVQKVEPASSQPEQRRSVTSVTSRYPSGVNSFKNNREMFEQKSSIKDAEIQKPKPRLNINSTVTSPASESTSKDHIDHPSKTETDSTSLSLEVQTNDSEEPQEVVDNDSQPSQSEVQEEIIPSLSTKVEVGLPKAGADESALSSVQKTPPPVAPKPRLSSSSSTKSEGNEETGEVLNPKPAPKISSGYERLQAITKSSKPSKIIEKSRTYVSSRAKMFDVKTDENSSAPEAASRRISVEGYAQQDGNSGSINTSLKPISERRKSTGTGLITKPLSLSQFSAAPKPNARSLTSVKRPTEISIPETSPRDNISQDSKIKSVVSPTRLNSALSPRRASSTDSPLSPPLSFSPRQVTSPREKKSVFVGDKYQSSSSSTKDNSGTFKYSSVTVHETESPLKTSPKSLTSPSQPTHQQTSYHSTTALTSPAPAQPSSTPDLTSQVSEEHLENTMKMFDDLLMDTPIVHSESDPVDLLIWAPVRMDSPRSPITDTQSSVSKTEQSFRKAPIAKPRSKPMEETLQAKDSKVNNTAPETPRDEKSSVQTSEVTLSQTSDSNVPSQKPEVSKQQIELQLKQTADVHDILRGSSEETSENIVALQVSESIINIQTPKEKQTDKIHRILSNQNDENSDNLVAALASEAINEDKLNKRKQDCDVHNRLKYVPEKDIENNIVATEIFNSMSEKSRSKQRQTSDTEALLGDPLKSVVPADNIIAMQISESLEKHIKVSSDSKSTENLMDALSNKVDDNLVADNLSKEMALDANQSDEQNEKENASEVCEEEDITTAQTYPTNLTNGDSEDGVYREHAQKIVQDVLAKATNDPTVNCQPDADPDEEEEPPPLPGAPPPPLILRNPVMLVSEQDLFDQGGVPVVPEGFSGSSFQQETPNSAVDQTKVFNNGDSSQMLVNSVELVNYETPSSEYQMTSSRSPSTEMVVSSSDSVEPLNSTSGSVSEGESHRLANSRSPDDMLSEDSGMPADEEFPEGATDDAISPPGELAETELSLRSVNTALLSSPPAISSENQSHPLEEHVEQTVGLQSNAAPSIPIVEVCDTKDDLPPPLPTTSLPPLSVQSPPITELDVSLSQTSYEDSSSLPLSNENPSPGDEVTYTPSETRKSFSNPDVIIEEEEINCVQEVPVSETPQVAEDTCEKDQVIVNDLTLEANGSKTSEVEDQNSIVHIVKNESVSSEEADSEDIVCVTSRRKWCFRSNSVEASPLLKADAGINTTLTYTDPSVVGVVPPSDLATLLEKANTVLDSADSSANLELSVVHLCRQAESRDLGVDLKHDGSIWFRISKLVEGGPAQLVGGIDVGDYLLALDSLWCGHVTVMRLLARLTKPKRDSLLVVARGERSKADKQDQTSSVETSHRPTPAPRPRSAIHTDSAKSQQARASDEGAQPNRDEEKPKLSQSTAPVPELPTNPPPLDIKVNNGPELTGAISPRKTEGAVVYSATVTAELQSPTDSTGSPQDSPRNQPEASSADEASTSGVFKVVMMKGATGVGFCLEGGKGSPKGDVPIIIKRIFKGGPAEKCGQLKVKDEILEVNGVDFQSMRHYEAWNHLKFLDDGEVCITVRRED